MLGRYASRQLTNSCASRDPSTLSFSVYDGASPTTLPSLPLLANSWCSSGTCSPRTRTIDTPPWPSLAKSATAYTASLRASGRRESPEGQPQDLAIRLARTPRPTTTNFSTNVSDPMVPPQKIIQINRQKSPEQGQHEKLIDGFKDTPHPRAVAGWGVICGPVAMVHPVPKPQIRYGRSNKLHSVAPGSSFKTT